MSDEPLTPPAPWLTPRRVTVLLALAALFAHFNALHGSFVFDDIGNIVLDPNIGKPLAGVLAPRPVASLSFTLNYRLDGLNVRGYHLLNVLVHWAAALTLYALARRTLLLPHFNGKFAGRAEWVALVVALLWFLHPLQTQSVTYIIQRCESMMGLFFLLTFLCFVRAVTTDGGRVKWYAAAVVSCALGAGCKEMTVALPPLLLLYDRTFVAGSWWAAVKKRWAFYMAVSVPPVLGAAYLVFGGVLSAPTVGSGAKNFTPTMYALTQTEVLLYYLRLIAWPSPLCLDYIDWKTATTLADCWPSVIGLAALLLLTLVGVLMRAWWGFFAAWYFLILAPTSSIVPLQDPAFEHRLYLPLLGVLCIVVGVVVGLLDRLGRGQRVAVALAGVLAAVFAFLTVVRNEDYSSGYRLWGDVVEKRPGAYRARGAKAGVLLEAGRTDDALKEVMQALKDFPSSPTNIRLLAFVYMHKGDVEKASEVLEGISRDPAWAADPELRFQLGICRLVQGRTGEGLTRLKEATELAPTNGNFRGTYAAALLQAGKAADADREFAPILARDPAAPRRLAQQARRLAFDPKATKPQLLQAEMFAAAASHMAKDADPVCLDTLGVVLARVGKFDAAANAAKKAEDFARAKGDAEYATRLARLAGLFARKKPYTADSFAE